MAVIDNDKQLAAETATQYIKNGMTVGLGSGSTVDWMLQKLGVFVKDGLDIKGIPTSVKTESLAKKYGIPLTDFSKTTTVDIAIDGADEIDDQLNLLKGGGGSLVREKIVDAMAKKLIIIADQSKMVHQLGSFPLPVEVVPFGWEVTKKHIAEYGAVPKLRKDENRIFVSDNGNYILDCDFERIEDPKGLHEKLKSLTGVVETGLFIGMTNEAIVGRNGTIEIIKANK
ncbi:ribose-5-phosphate isomerase RpiA [Virgibacillus siamensis]|uniref:ribose-5-phosphate isomerase RpiA n=1 Tax=Virgibacillus siamensis TaxID=480071 RepID=UPI0009871590|nr:ribose-5-phosphate isomerase RpiA [Virgibacillus siamensis]